MNQDNLKKFEMGIIKGPGLPQKPENKGQDQQDGVVQTAKFPQSLQLFNKGVVDKKPEPNKFQQVKNLGLM